MEGWQKFGKNFCRGGLISHDLNDAFLVHNDKYITPCLPTKTNGSEFKFYRSVTKIYLHKNFILFLNRK